jgi:2-oxoglutarate dehydrogenase complex dehydrogenase (E1) component-like enzyme
MKSCIPNVMSTVKSLYFVVREDKIIPSPRHVPARTIRINGIHNHLKVIWTGSIAKETQAIAINKRKNWILKRMRCDNINDKGEINLGK